jgi:hypothetical protein
VLGGGNDGNSTYLYNGETLRQLSHDSDWAATNVAQEDDAQRLYATLVDVGGTTL